MLQQPREREGGARAAAVQRHFVESRHDASRLIALLRRQKFRGAIGEKSCAERTPGERCHLLRHALMDRPVLECAELQEADFDLVDSERCRAGGLQKCDLRWAEIADTEVTHLAGARELRESFCDFMRIHQPIGSMDLENVDGFDAEPRQ